MYTDVLNQLRNAQAARRERVKVSFSRLTMAIAELLLENKFIAGVEKKGRLPKRTIEIRLKYDDLKQGAIRGIRFISKPSRRFYSGYRDLQSVKQGRGLSIISTPQGIMTNRGARDAKVGGEVLFEIW